MTPETNYGFRQRLDAVHRPNRRDPEATPGRDEVAIAQGWRLVVPANASTYMQGVAADLQDYLFTSMGVSTLLVREGQLGSQGGQLDSPAGPAIVLGTGGDLPQAGADLSAPGSYRLQVEADCIRVCGAHERSAGQACYHLEDLMNLREAPFLSLGDQVREPVFSPRMVHSGWGIDQFPDAHLNAIAHAGFTAILVFAKGVNQTTTGFVDLNDVIARAARFGLDVYLYSYIISAKHPGDADAEAFYESTYGELMRAHPGARGVVFVGESCEFPSRDEHTTRKLRSERSPSDTKPNPGWWPCRDYPEWLELVKRVIRKYNPAADVVFWTYNWGWAPEKDRLALIESLPQDISLQATFEMFENREQRGTATRCVDYTVSFAGPGQYFSSEAEAAHRRGLPLYAMSNTGGMTWDFGMVPYEPVPYQWARRHRALLKANADWGLCGLMESHHMGWWPSVVSELAKWSFWRPHTTSETILPRIAGRDFGEDGAGAAIEAWRHWSEAIGDYVPTNEDQYGPFRVGPAYPLLLGEGEIEFPAADHAHFGSAILKTAYRPHDPAILDGEIACLEAMAARWSQGIEAMGQAVAAAPERKREEGGRMLGLGKFIGCCVRTTIHVKRWWQTRQELAGTDAGAADEVLDRLEALGRAEIENVKAAIPLVELDSRLGWEPSMEYMADRAHLEWKLDQVEKVLEEEIPRRRGSCRP